MFKGKCYTILIIFSSSKLDIYLGACDLLSIKQHGENTSTWNRYKITGGIGVSCYCSNILPGIKMSRFVF